MKINKIITVLLVSGMCSSAMAYELNSTYETESPYKAHREAAVSSAVGTPWNAKRHKQLIKSATDASALLEDAPDLSYPISEESLKEIYGDKATIPFFAYSSLIDKESPAAKAITPTALATLTPAIAFGVQRTFNRKMPGSAAENWGALRRPNDVAILNAFEKEDAVANGVVLQLPMADLMVLAKREVGYDLVPVLAMRWNDAIDSNKTPELFVAYTFIAPDYEGSGEQFTSDQINPIPGYVTFLQKGLKPFGEDFEAMWWATTFMGDKETPLSEVIYSDIDLGETPAAPNSK